MLNKKVHWGVLGCAHIALNYLIPAIKASVGGEVYALASRELSRAKHHAEKLEIPKYYGSYQELIDDPEIEAVYIPLPNALHREWAIKAAQKGKHVLCEKPLAPTAQEAREMKKAADENHVLLWEAFMWRFHPRTKQLKDLLDLGVVGDIKFIRGGFSYYLEHRQETRLSPNLVGGALMDVGCYPVNFARLVTGAEPLRVFASMDFLPGSELLSHPVDTATMALMDFPGQIKVSFSCRFDTGFEGQWMEIVGRHGRLYLDWPFNPKTEHLGILLTNEDIKPYQFIPSPHDDHFRLEVEEFQKCIEMPSVIDSLTLVDKNMIGQAKVLEALYQSGQTNQPINL
ncbi:MAG: Gfo/Idh/MocA family oxidoreductase [Pseudomonadota bacterium]